MKLSVEVVLACLISVIMIHQIRCDELSDASSRNKWTCTCSSAYRWNSSFAVSANCTSSCNCSPGSTSETESTRNRLSTKLLVIILLSYVILTILAFVGSFICYIYRRKKCPIKRPSFSSDKDTSYNSASNLISHRATSVPEFKVYIGSPFTSISGCVQKASFLFRSRTGTMRGTLLHFSFSELETVTNKFSNSNLIGIGGSSKVYCGHLKDGEIVAVKRMKAQEGIDAAYDFLTEIDLISRLHHCHVVPLLGFCSENQGKYTERLQVFEYMPNGNLRENLDRISGKCLDWVTRVSIALGAAKGLEYLHEAAAPRILHRDVKSTNILLDEKWRAKITDLGMAKHLRNEGMPSCSSSPARVQGTFGYFAPEYAIVGRASLKSDVFSFGVVLLEIITGQQPIRKSAEKEESLVMWATPRLQDSRRVILELPDPHLQGNYPEEEIQIMAYLAKECLLLDPDSRPTMSEVVQILSTIAPEKSRRRNFSVNLFPRSPIHRSENKPECSQPLHNHRTRCVEKDAEEVDTASECVEKLMLSTSNARSLCLQDDETLDLTEPQFESFCVPNMGPLL